MQLLCTHNLVIIGEKKKLCGCEDTKFQCSKCGVIMWQLTKKCQSHSS